MALRVAQSIFVPVRKLGTVAHSHLLKLFDGPVPRSFQIDADTTVQGSVGHVEIQVGYACFDDLIDWLPRLLVVRDADLNGLFRHEARPHTARDATMQAAWELEELVDLAAMLVVDLHAATDLRVGVLGIGVDDLVVQPTIHDLVLRLKKCISFALCVL